MKHYRRCRPDENPPTTTRDHRKPTPDEEAARLAAEEEEDDWNELVEEGVLDNVIREIEEHQDGQ